jgi:hypothetical protein
MVGNELTGLVTRMNSINLMAQFVILLAILTKASWYRHANITRSDSG